MQLTRWITFFLKHLIFKPQILHFVKLRSNFKVLFTEIINQLKTGRFTRSSCKKITPIPKEQCTSKGYGDCWKRKPGRAGNNHGLQYNDRCLRSQRNSFCKNAPFHVTGSRYTGDENQESDSLFFYAFHLNDPAIHFST